MSETEPAIVVPISILQEISQSLRELSIPKFQYGKKYFGVAGWHTIQFKEPFKEVPTVGGLMLARPAWYTKDFFEPPHLNLSEVRETILDYIDKIDSVPDIDIDFPDVPDLNLTDKIRQSFRNAAREKLGDWPYPVSFATEKIVDAFGEVGVKLADVMEVDVVDALWDQLSGVSAVIEGEINGVIDRVREAINDAIDKIRNALTRATNIAVRRIENTTNQITEYSTRALNESIDKIWEMTGADKGLMPSSIQLDNVTQTSFDIKSPGVATFHWCAFGGLMIPGMPVADKIDLLINEVR